MNRCIKLSLVFLLLLLATATSRAQFAQRGGIAGTVFDLAQNQCRQIKADAAGHFEFDNLAAGRYQLTAVHDGFGTKFPLHENLHLQFRADAFNAFNHSQWNGIVTTYPSGSTQYPFGQVNGAGDALIGQVAAKAVV
jgi:hypothetical protein